jgi:hypothetical protein
VGCEILPCPKLYRDSDRRWHGDVGVLDHSYGALAAYAVGDAKSAYRLSLSTIGIRTSAPRVGALTLCFERGCCDHKE